MTDTTPARTYTAEGTVGIGGVYMCIYGMDSPGGYQLVGRTLPIWNRQPQHPAFVKGEPWLLKFFDQVRYYPVSEEELDQQRQAFREGRLEVRVEYLPGATDVASLRRAMSSAAMSVLQQATSFAVQWRSGL